jgi:hypothetical protein
VVKLAIASIFLIGLYDSDNVIKIDGSVGNTEMKLLSANKVRRAGIFEIHPKDVILLKVMVKLVSSGKLTNEHGILPLYCTESLA